MNPIFRENRWFIVISLLFFGIIAYFSMIIPYGDEIIRLNGLRHAPWNAVFIFFTKLGEIEVWVIAAIFLAIFKNYRAGLIVLLAGLTVLLSAFLAKDVLHTDRPAAYLSSINREKEVVFVPNVEVFRGKTSFPSGHTMSAFAFWGMMAIVSRRRVWVDIFCALIACGVGFSRIFLCEHFLVDVGAGGSLGLLIFFIFWQISRNTRFLTRPVFFKSVLKKSYF
jgi:membrane-associated phospholipid phosphatase